MMPCNIRIRSLRHFCGLRLFGVSELENTKAILRAARKIRKIIFLKKIILLRMYRKTPFITPGRGTFALRRNLLRPRLCLGPFSTKTEKFTQPAPERPGQPNASHHKKPAASFWSCRHTWKRARINTLRCLVGCTIGDFSMLWALQAWYPEIGMSSIMALSSKYACEKACNQ